MLKGVLILVFCLLIVIARGDVVTTLLIDNFSSTLGVVTSFHQDINSNNSELTFEDTYYTGNRPATLCTYNNPTQTNLHQPSLEETDILALLSTLTHIFLVEQ